MSTGPTGVLLPQAASCRKPGFAQLGACFCSWWRFYSRWQLQRAIAERSHLVFMVVFYLMTAFILGILGGSVYLYFMHKSRKKMKWQW